ncbi:UNVERIFIED_CONTAM: hypothetical protein GTU68_052165 [Idotea baltica]|nr:hypothetical protein [Idotea baltica]
MVRLWLLLSSFFGFSAIVLGAFAAHALKKILTDEQQAIFHTATYYQMIHSLALFGIALLSLYVPGRIVNIAGLSFLLGIILFSGSLYLLTLTGCSKLGIITPVGGIAFLVGWFCLGLAALQLPNL